MRHVVLFEPDPSGHRMVFVRYIVEAMARRGGIRATLVTSRHGVTPWVAAAQERLGDRLSVEIVDAAPPGRLHRLLPRKLSRQFDWTRRLEASVARLHVRRAVDHVLIPFLDDYGLFPFAWRGPRLGSVPWTGIAIRPRFHLAGAGVDVPPRREDKVEAWAYRRLLRDRSLATLFSIDPYFPSAIADPRLVAVCDPADMAAPLSGGAWPPGVPDDAVMLLVYGYVDQRKAIDRLLRVAVDPAMPTSLVVALVGVQDPGMASVLNGPDAAALRAQHRLVEVARRVDDAEEASALQRADIVWGYYPGSYCSSGAMVRAGRMGRALVTTDEGLAGALTRQHGSGLTAPEADDAALLRQIARLVADADLRAALGTRGADAFADATGVAFGDRIVARLVRGDGA